ncbi:transglycosylase SLT domain-containing protein [Streptomyces sp. NPDC017936]|uniref:transglycosylase SLT domain-containing protein n=1 Tax=Streptomyces sp. NPDC017936 TaxID=3365016 RepID=UPI00378F296F
MMVVLSHVRFGKRNEDVEATQAALIAVGADIPAGATGFFGEQTRSAYAAWQRMLGFTGPAADGFPGCSSLAELGARAGFVVDCRHPGAIAKSSVRFSRNSGVAVDEDTARAFAEQACARTGAPMSWVTGAGDGANLLTLVFRESSFRPNAVNQDDVNATGPVQTDGARLNCSRGYAQVIPDTFAVNHQAGTSERIYEPVANIAAAINYIWRRYGDISRVQQANPHRDPAPY